MEKPNPIRLPYELEKEELEAKERAIKERIDKERADNTLFFHLIDFLKEFEEKTKVFNQYLQLYTPYPTISRTIKNVVRNKLRDLNEFYNSFSGSNPYSIIHEFDKKNDNHSIQLRLVYGRISTILNELNKNIACISDKQIIMNITEKHREFDWT